MAQEAFDLAEQFQTPVFVMSDLDLGMNNWMSDGFKYPGQADQARQGAHGRDAQEARRVGPLQGRRRRRHSRIARCPATACPSYFTRGSGHNAKGQYSERPDDYVEHGPARHESSRRRAQFVPKPVIDRRRREDRVHRLRHDALGDSESRDQLREEPSQDVVLPAARVAVHDELAAFIAAHDASTSSNRTATASCAADAARALARSGITKLRSVLHYNGLPIDARTITEMCWQEGFEVAEKTAAARARA